MFKIERFWNLLVIACVGSISLAATGTTVGADGWDFVYGDSTPYDYSAFLSTTATSTGGTFLFGQYAGRFEDLDGGSRYHLFVQYRSATGALLWTKKLIADHSGCTEDFDLAAEVSDNGHAYFVAAGCYDDTLGSFGFRGSVSADGLITFENVGTDDGVSYSSWFEYNNLGNALVLSEGGGLLSLTVISDSANLGPNGPELVAVTVKKQDFSLAEVWRVELPSDLLSSTVAARDSMSLAASSDGGAWVAISLPRPLPHMSDALALVQISANGEILKTVRHNGFRCTSPDLIRQTAQSVWIDGCANETGYPDLPIDPARLAGIEDVWAFSAIDGRSLGRVPGFSGLDNPLIRPRVEIPGSLFDCGIENSAFNLWPVDDCRGFLYVTSVYFEWGLASFANNGETLIARLETELSGKNTYLGVWSIHGDGADTTFTLIYSTLLPDEVRVGDIDVLSDSLLTVGSTTADSAPALRSKTFRDGGATSAFATTTYIRALRDRCAKSRTVTAEVGNEREGFNALVSPVRVLDTRAEGPVGDLVDGDEGSCSLNMRSISGIPSSASAVAMNVTIVNGQTNGGGYVTVYPCGTIPYVSNINFTSGQTVANSVIAPISDDGEICFYVHGQGNILADISGYFTAGFEP